MIDDLVNTLNNFYEKYDIDKKITLWYDDKINWNIKWVRNTS
jgi:hypothetical protein